MNFSFNQIKQIAENRSTEVLKQDVIVAYARMTLKKTEATKIVYHAINEILIERLSKEDFESFEKTYR